MYFTDVFLTPIAVRISAFLSAEVMYFINPPSRGVSNGGSVQIPPFSCAEFMYFTDSAAPFFF